MKKYPKIVQCDERGQIVIPKDVRDDLEIEGGTGFWVYTVTDEGLLLKKIKKEELESQSEILSEIINKSDKINVNKENIVRTLERYKKRKKGRLDLI